MSSLASQFLLNDLVMKLNAAHLLLKKVLQMQVLLVCFLKDKLIRLFKWVHQKRWWIRNLLGNHCNRGERSTYHIRHCCNLVKGVIKATAYLMIKRHLIHVILVVNLLLFVARMLLLWWFLIIVLLWQDRNFCVSNKV